MCPDVQQPPAQEDTELREALKSPPAMVSRVSALPPTFQASRFKSVSFASFNLCSLSFEANGLAREIIDQNNETGSIDHTLVEKLKPDHFKLLNPEDKAGLFFAFKTSKPSASSEKAAAEVLEVVFRNTDEVDAFVKSYHELLPKDEVKACLPDAHEIGSHSAESIVKAAFQKALLSDLDLEQQAFYFQEEMTLEEYLGSLRYMTSSSRVSALTSLYDSTMNSADIMDFLRRNNDDLHHYTSTEERIDLINHVLQDATCNHHTGEIIASILRSSRNLKELTEIVDAVGKQKLLDLINDDLKEYVAHVTLGNKIRNLGFPGGIEPDASQETVVSHINSQVEFSRRMHAVCKAHPELQDTAVAAEYRKIAAAHFSQSKTWNHQFKELMDPGPPDIDQIASPDGELPPDHQEVEQANIDFIIKEINNSMALLGLELRYGLYFTVGESSTTIEASPGTILTVSTEPWNEEEIQALKETLEKFPEGTILFLPNLFEVRKEAIILGHHRVGGYVHPNNTVLIRAGLPEDENVLSELPENERHNRLAHILVMN